MLKAWNVISSYPVTAACPWTKTLNPSLLCGWKLRKTTSSECLKCKLNPLRSTGVISVTVVQSCWSLAAVIRTADGGSSKCFVTSLMMSEEVTHFHSCTHNRLILPSETGLCIKWYHAEWLIKKNTTLLWVCSFYYSALMTCIQPRSRRVQGLYSVLLFILSLHSLFIHVFH